VQAPAGHEAASAYHVSMIFSKCLRQRDAFACEQQGVKENVLKEASISVACLIIKAAGAGFAYFLT
jgi:hypothetical protein